MIVYSVIHTDAKVVENRRFLLTLLPPSTVLLLGVWGEEMGMDPKQLLWQPHKQREQLSLAYPHSTGHFS